MNEITHSFILWFIPYRIHSFEFLHTTTPTSQLNLKAQRPEDNRSQHVTSPDTSRDRGGLMHAGSHDNMSPVCKSPRVSHVITMLEGRRWQGVLACTGDTTSSLMFTLPGLICPGYAFLKSLHELFLDPSTVGAVFGWSATHHLLCLIRYQNKSQLSWYYYVLKGYTTQKKNILSRKCNSLFQFDAASIEFKMLKFIQWHYWGKLAKIISKVDQKYMVLMSAIRKGLFGYGTFYLYNRRIFNTSLRQ